ICKAVRNGNRNITDKLVKCMPYYPEDWQKRFLQNLQDLTDPENPLMYLPDGTPFLKGEPHL
ncbi:MAG TPA: hypothetical protein VIX58_05530, partial [Anaerolineae bacterium]